jgi:hypothetical protein
MSQAYTFSDATREIFIERADDAQQTQRGKGIRKLMIAFGAAAAAAGAAILCPPSAPVTVAAVVLGAGGVLSGVFAAGDFAGVKMMDNIRKEAGDEDFVEKMSGRHARLQKFLARTKIVENGSLVVMGAAGLAALLAPASPVAWPLYFAANAAFTGSWSLRTATKEAAETLAHANMLAQDLLVPAETPAPVQAGMASGTAAPPLAPAFGVQADPAAPRPAVATVVPKAPSPNGP